METISKLSKKQKCVIKWAHMDKYKDIKAIICDGSVRSGKTVSMIIGFIHWAMRNFDGCNFAICGKTVGSTERNIITPLMQMVDISYYYKLSYRRSDKLLTISGAKKQNKFYVFGGKDESSYTLIQGITLSGVLFDEVALMPKSFVDQAVARTLSVPKSRYWFNCNPDSSEHWFFREWIQNPEQKRALHLHFTMHDNPILSDDDIKSAEALYSGVFYERYILGLWCVAEGLIYPLFDKSKHIVHIDDVDSFADRCEMYLSCDYGTKNPTSVGLWCVDDNGVATRVKEYYYSGRDSKRARTDDEHYNAIVEFAGAYADKIRYIVVDPSAASFIECIRRHGLFRVRHANNAVLDGIRDTATLLQLGYLRFNDTCKDAIREFGLYRWDDKVHDDKPIKDNDHAMDDIRYFVKSAMHRKLADIRRGGGKF